MQWRVGNVGRRACMVSAPATAKAPPHVRAEFYDNVLPPAIFTALLWLSLLSSQNCSNTHTIRPMWFHRLFYITSVLSQTIHPLSRHTKLLPANALDDDDTWVRVLLICDTRCDYQLSRRVGPVQVEAFFKHPTSPLKLPTTALL